MHSAAIIIKHKSVSVEDARDMIGTYLVDHNVADWYSTDDYRERTFDEGKVTISLDEFIKVWKDEFLPTLKQLDDDEKYPMSDAWVFGVVSEYVDDIIIPTGFYEFYDIDISYRIKLINIYTEAYKEATDKILHSCDPNEYDVVLLDYHH